MTQRNVVSSQYEVNANGIITSLGKFEREPVFAVHFYDAYLNGASSYESANVSFFEVDAEDRAEFPELAEVYGVALEESERGFVSVVTYKTQAEYEAAIVEVEAGEMEFSEEDGI